MKTLNVRCAEGRVWEWRYEGDDMHIWYPFADTDAEFIDALEAASKPLTIIYHDYGATLNEPSWDGKDPEQYPNLAVKSDPFPLSITEQEILRLAMYARGYQQNMMGNCGSDSDYYATAERKGLLSNDRYEAIEAWSRKTPDREWKWFHAYNA